MAVHIDASATVDSTLVDQEVSTTATVEIGFDETGRRYPLHIVFCIDTSGSMRAEMSTDGSVRSRRQNSIGGQKIAVAKNGLVEASRQLSDDDCFGVVSFSNQASTEIQPTNGDRARRSESDIQALQAGGGTDIRAGLEQSRQLLERMPAEEAIEWIVLISDGQGTVPTNSRLERAYSDVGITIQAAGIGDDYNEDTLRELAHYTQGEQRHIKSPEQLQNFFEEKVRDARDVVALDPSLSLSPSDITTINDVYYTLGDQQSSIDPDWQGGDCHIEMADLNREKPPTVKADLDVRPDEPGLAATLLRATLESGAERVEDEISVEVGTAHTLGTIEEPAKDEEFLLRQITDKAMNEGVDAARQEYRLHRDDLSADARTEVESTLETMEQDEKTGTDQFSTLPSKIDDE